MSTRSHVTAAAALLAALALSACDSPSAPKGPLPPRGIVVLNGWGTPGLTLVADTGTASAHLRFDDPFDGGAMALARDTVLTTSSSWSGDLLFVADVGAGTVRTIQMPAGSNPAGAAVAPTGVVVALRNTGQLAVVTNLGAQAPTVTTIAGAGSCPMDAFVHQGATWSVDRNADCAGSYASLGASRLIRIPATGTTRDTIRFGGAVVHASSAIVDGSLAYVSAVGEYDWGTGQSVSPGAIVKVDLATRTVAHSLSLPDGTWGATTRRGQDRQLYVTAYTDPMAGTTVTYRIDPATMAYGGARAAGHQHLALRTQSGAAPNCVAATGDALGRVYCVETSYSAGATLYVFDPSGAQLRAVPVGQGGVDVGLR